MEDDDDRLAHERLADAQEKIARTLSGAAQVDPLVFVVTGQEIQTLLLERAARLEQAAKKHEEDEQRPQHGTVRRLPSFGAHPVDPGAPSAYLLPPPMAEIKREGAKTLRFLASHIEEDRVFRLALHDLQALGLFVNYSL